MAIFKTAVLQPQQDKQIFEDEKISYRWDYTKHWMNSKYSPLQKIQQLCKLL